MDVWYTVNEVTVLIFYRIPLKRRLLQYRYRVPATIQVPCTDFRVSSKYCTVVYIRTSVGILIAIALDVQSLTRYGTVSGGTVP